MVKRAKQSFWAGKPPRMVHAGDLVADNDPIVKGREHLFEDAGAYVQREARRVEQATSAPGERRSVAPAPKPAEQAKPPSGRAVRPRKTTPKGEQDGDEK